MRIFLLELFLFSCISGSSTRNDTSGLCKSIRRDLRSSISCLMAELENSLKKVSNTNEKVFLEALNRTGTRTEEYPKDEIISLVYTFDSQRRLAESRSIFGVFLRNNFLLNPERLERGMIGKKIMLLRAVITFFEDFSGDNNLFNFLLKDTYLMCKNIGRVFNEPKVSQRLIPIVELIGYRMFSFMNMYSEFGGRFNKHRFNNKSWLQARDMKGMKPRFLEWLKELHSNHRDRFVGNYDDLGTSIEFFEETLKMEVLKNIERGLEKKGEGVEKTVLTDMIYRIYQNMSIVKSFRDLFMIISLLFDDDYYDSGFITSIYRKIYLRLSDDKNLENTTAYDNNKLIACVNLLISSLLIRTQRSGLNTLEVTNFLNTLITAISDVKKQTGNKPGVAPVIQGKQTGNKPGVAPVIQGKQKMGNKPGVTPVIQRTHTLLVSPHITLKAQVYPIIESLKDSEAILMLSSIKDVYPIAEAKIRELAKRRIFLGRVFFLCVSLLIIDTLLFSFLLYLYLA